MDARTLIDSIVRQTTVLIAQISTSAGIRAPLAHVADQVFLDLAREIERQGVRQKVVADMFGVALRTYQKKVEGSYNWGASLTGSPPIAWVICSTSASLVIEPSVTATMISTHCACREMP